jgi:hypothetical protein
MMCLFCYYDWYLFLFVFLITDEHGLYCLYIFGLGVIQIYTCNCREGVNFLIYFNFMIVMNTLQ